MSTDQTELDEFDEHEQTVVIATGNHGSRIYHTDADCPNGPQDGHFERPLSWAKRYEYRECRHCSGERADGEYNRYGYCSVDGCGRRAVTDSIDLCRNHVHRLEDD